jgi:hypothetical protein
MFHTRDKCLFLWPQKACYFRLLIFHTNFLRNFLVCSQIQEILLEDILNFLVNESVVSLV